MTAGLSTHHQPITTRIRARIDAQGYDTAPFGKPRNTAEEIGNARAALKLVSNNPAAPAGNIINIGHVNQPRFPAHE